MWPVRPSASTDDLALTVEDEEEVAGVASDGADVTARHLTVPRLLMTRELDLGPTPRSPRPVKHDDVFSAVRPREPHAERQWREDLLLGHVFDRRPDRAGI